MRVPDALVAALAEPDSRALAAALRNDLEHAAVDLRPELGELLEAGERAGALRGLISGSGPTCVFLCTDRGVGRPGPRARCSTTAIPRCSSPSGRSPAPTSWSTCLMAQPAEPREGHQVLRRPDPARRGEPGVGEGERIGIVGRNGDGKTTLLNLMAGRVAPDSGRVSQSRGLHIGYLDQRDLLDDTHSVREVVLAGKADHEWAGDARTREVVEVLLADVALDREVHGLSGGERRRCSLARLLLDDVDLLILDEPTNHLDVEAVAWLAEHLVRRTSALVVVTHDRWFLDAVCERTWEVHPGPTGRGCGRRLRRRVRRLRARPRGAAAPGRLLGVEAAEPRPQGARVAASRCPRRARRSRSSASTRPTT